MKRIPYTCIHCGSVRKVKLYFDRWHGDNCTKAPDYAARATRTITYVDYVRELKAKLQS